MMITMKLKLYIRMVNYMTFKELKEASGMNIKQFSEYFNIPYKTVQKWNSGERSCSDYLLDLMHYKLKNENILRDKV